jgi:uncharacterized protein (TIGR00369 family)
MMPGVTEDRLAQRFARLESAGEPHLWQTLGYRAVHHGPGTATIGWDATADYGFPTAAGHRVHGGMVTAVLDTAMGGATWTVLDEDEVFLTADLRVEFHRATPVGPLTATGTVLKRTRRVVFVEAQLFDAEQRVLAASRATQVVLPADGPAGRYGAGDSGDLARG